MIAKHPTLEQKAQALLQVLDNDMAYIERNLKTLDQLRQLVIKRDEQGLRTLLETIRHQNIGYHQNEQRREQLRAELAQLAQCLPSDMTLSHLETYLGQSTRQQIQTKKKQLRLLTRQLHADYKNTAVLLNDCARLNRALLKAMFKAQPGQGMTYRFNGALKRNASVNMLNLSF